MNKPKAHRTSTKSWTYQDVTAAAEARIASLSEQARDVPDDAWRYRQWAYGVVLGWEHLVRDEFDEADQDRLHELASKTGKVESSQAAAPSDRGHVPPKQIPLPKRMPPPP